VKYLQNGGYEGQPLMRLTLSLCLVMLGVFWLTNLGMYFRHMTLDPATVVAYYRGNDAQFVPPRSAESMLEVTHMHLPVFALVLLLLTHLVIFVPMRNGAKVALIVTAFASALLSEGAGWLVRFVHPGFAWLKVGMFVVFQLALAWLLLRLAWFLARARARGASPHAAHAGGHARPGGGHGATRHRRGHHGPTHPASESEIPGNQAPGPGVEQD
jgi:hypothetical protein